MLRLITATLMTLIVALPATAQTVCMERDHVLTTIELEGEHAEVPVAVGLSDDGKVVEIAASRDGSWTVIVTDPNKVSCIVASGVAWQEMGADPIRAARM